MKRHIINKRQLNIIKESDFGWVDSEEANYKPKTYRFNYRMECFIDADSEEEANEIFQNMDLGSLRENMVYDELTKGLKDYEWYETVSINLDEE